MTRHKHADAIIAYANNINCGIQFRRTSTGDWIDAISDPSWSEEMEYRIKPKDDVKIKMWQWIFKSSSGTISLTTSFYKKKEEAHRHVGHSTKVLGPALWTEIIINETTGEIV